MSRGSDTAALRELAALLKALGDRSRLRVVQHLALSGETTVSELGRALRISQPLMSWHLRILRKAGLVRTQKLGRQVYCALDHAVLHSALRQLDTLVSAGAAGGPAPGPGLQDAAGAARVGEEAQASLG
jgi:DNA-binding transcriptional ArsR family regulator